MSRFTDTDKRLLGGFVVVYTAFMVAAVMMRDSNLLEDNLKQVAPAPTPEQLIRGLNDTCMTFVNVTDKRQHIYCNLRWHEQPGQGDFQTPGWRRFRHRTKGWPLIYDIRVPHFMHGQPDEGLPPMLFCGEFEVSKGPGWPVTHYCHEPRYLFNNRPCNGLLSNATAEQVENLITYGWYRDVATSEWEHYGNVTGVRTWQVYVTCALQ
jgi:hypothetical protein